MLRIVRLSLVLSLFFAVPQGHATGPNDENIEKLGVFLEAFVASTEAVKGAIKQGDKTIEVPHMGPRYLSQDQHRICVVSNTYPAELPYFSDLEKVLFFATDQKTTLHVTNNIITCSQFTTIYVLHSLDRVSDEEVAQAFQAIQSLPVPEPILNALTFDVTMRNDILQMPVHPFTKSVIVAEYGPGADGAYPHSILLHLLMKALSYGTSFDSGEERISVLDNSFAQQIASGTITDAPHGLCVADVFLLQLLSKVPFEEELSAQFYVDFAVADEESFLDGIGRIFTAPAFIAYFDQDC